MYLLTMSVSPARRRDLISSRFSHLFAAKSRCCSSAGSPVRRRGKTLSPFRSVSHSLGTTCAPLLTPFLPSHSGEQEALGVLSDCVYPFDCNDVTARDFQDLAVPSTQRRSARQQMTNADASATLA